ncbi:MAG: hypothetical protein GEU79_06285 [Acidimicrobiia bacterium]|nr:hypothetical protein [Acidimicrobiia bacterium]
MTAGLVAVNLLLLIAGCSAPAETADPPTEIGLARAHAHNDYLQERPLLDALGHGFTSVEADVWLSDGELLVAHDLDEVEPEQTLRSLYLDPLSTIVEDNEGVVYPGGPATLTLLVDVKSEADPTYQELESQLTDYEQMLTLFSPDGVTPGAVTVVVSGNRSEVLLDGSRERLAAYDGRLDDLSGAMPASIIPLISDDWTEQFSWSGSGAMPTQERARLEGIVSMAHDTGRRVRLWATPETEKLWEVLVDVGVDTINTDRLADLGDFLLESDPDPAQPEIEPWPKLASGE